MAKHWLEFPPVNAPSPDDPNKMLVCKISQNFVSGNAFIARRSPIFQIWAHVVGELPPIAHVDMIANQSPTTTLCKLTDAVACFRGVKRPYDSEGNGESILVYVLTPTASIAYHPSMTCLARVVEVPANTVLTVQMRPSSTLQTPEQGIDGIITRVEFVSSSEGGSPFPAHHESRYDHLLWKR
jgi:hypothetical protein